MKGVNNNDLAKYAVEILKRYAKENQCNVRTTMDLSPLEQWLIVSMYVLKKESGE